MIVHIPSPLRSYTKGLARVEASGKTVADLLENLDAQYQGIKFRMIDEQECIRRHIKIFVNCEEIKSLDNSLRESDTVHIIAALSGG